MDLQQQPRQHIFGLVAALTGYHVKVQGCAMFDFGNKVIGKVDAHVSNKPPVIQSFFINSSQLTGSPLLKGRYSGNDNFIVNATDQTLGTGMDSTSWKVTVEAGYPSLPGGDIDLGNPITPFPGWYYGNNAGGNWKAILFNQTGLATNPDYSQGSITGGANNNT